MRSGFATAGLLFVAAFILASVGVIYLLNVKQQAPSISSDQNLFESNKPSSPPGFKKAKTSDSQGKIAFVSEGEIWTIRSDGKDLQQITKDENNKFHISISLDKKRIAYAFYPKDEQKRTNQGFYVGYNSGLAVVDLESKKSIVLIPYGDVQNHYPTWSPDSQYIAVWVGNGAGAKIVNTDSDAVVFQRSLTDIDYKKPEQSSISPFVWLSSSKVAFVEKGSLVTQNIDGSGKRFLVNGADALRIVHEGPNVPMPPYWSPNGNYLVFYKNGDTHLLDIVNNKDTLIQKGTESMVGTGRVTLAYPLAFNSDESILYLYNSTKENDTIAFDIKSGKFEEIGDLGHSAIVSPDKKTLLGRVNNDTQIINLGENPRKICGGKFYYNFYQWGGGIGYTFRFDTWSPDSKSIIGYRRNFDDKDVKGINILNVASCTLFDLVTDKDVLNGDAVWFPD